MTETEREVAEAWARGGKIALVGEAWGAQEYIAKAPFVGLSGQELTRMLSDAGIKRSDCFLTNVFNEKPPSNDLNHFLSKKARTGSLLSATKPEYHHHLERLSQELTDLKSSGLNIAVALGATASWALCDRPKITASRGNVYESTLVPGLKVIPTYHPAAVLRQWSWRVVAVADLIKVKIQSTFPEIRRTSRDIWISPTISDLHNFHQKYLRSADLITFDIETPSGQIDCVGISTSKRRAIVVPFVDKRKPGYSYWPSQEEEVEAWSWVKSVLENPIPKLGQNGLYDIQWLWRRMGIRVMNYQHDTMILSHAQFPELPKSLGFLGSIYATESDWKEMRGRAKSMKRDD